MNDPHSAPRPPFTGFMATIHGLDPGTVTLLRDEKHHALHIYLDDDRDMSIRIQLPGGSAPHDPAELERDRKGLRRLAAVATQAAQHIEEIQHGPAPFPPEGGLQ